ncbi:Hypothetical_protein [Hexamita inflata]|uniref:Hypothetical_protein n=1 Tax=Hexamita inflata TaxID=28002 RepID=A0AA86QV51_9EUKA|nr:Hypothetical protein HINF_LOCUS39504 [Hexamita inflata]CAI9960228.1 Hypothetical protein HINF_LOCUS47873 [Hexamita inflata]
MAFLIAQTLTCYSDYDLVLAGQQITINFKTPLTPSDTTFCSKALTNPLTIMFKLSAATYLSFETSLTPFQQSIILNETHYKSLNSQTFNVTMNSLLNTLGLKVIYDDVEIFTSTVDQTTGTNLPVIPKPKANMAIPICIGLFGIVLPIAIIITLIVYFTKKHSKKAFKESDDYIEVNSLDEVKNRSMFHDSMTGFPTDIQKLFKKNIHQVKECDFVIQDVRAKVKLNGGIDGLKLLNVASQLISEREVLHSAKQERDDDNGIITIPHEKQPENGMWKEPEKQVIEEI